MAIIRDLKTSLILDLKIIGGRKTPWIILGFLIVCFFLLTGNLVEQAEERSSVPIGIVDQDQTEESKKLINNLKEANALFVYEGNRKEMERLLRQERILALFEIRKDYEEKVRDGNGDELILMEYLGSNQLAMTVSDMIAGEIMYELCLGKSYQFYQTLGKNYPFISREEYEKISNRQKNSDFYDFGFQVKMENVTKNGEDEKNLENRLVYYQVIVGFTGILLSFVLLFFVEILFMEKGNLIEGRIRLSQFHNWIFTASHCMIILFLILVFAAGNGIYFSYIMEFNKISWILAFVGAECLSGTAYLVLFVFIRRKTKTREAFLSICSLCVLLMGGGSLVGLFYHDFIIFSKFMPNYWFIQTFTDIIT